MAASGQAMRVAAAKLAPMSMAAATTALRCSSGRVSSSGRASAVLLPSTTSSTRPFLRSVMSET